MSEPSTITMSAAHWLALSASLLGSSGDADGDATFTWVGCAPRRGPSLRAKRRRGRARLNRLNRGVKARWWVEWLMCYQDGSLGSYARVVTARCPVKAAKKARRRILDGIGASARRSGGVLALALVEIDAPDDYETWTLPDEWVSPRDVPDEWGRPYDLTKRVASVLGVDYRRIGE